MTVCVAGKNEMAINIAYYIKYNCPNIKLLGIVNEDDKGVNGYFRSYKWFLNFENIDNCTLDEIYNIDYLVFLSLEFDKLVNPNMFITKKLYNLHFSLLPAYKGMFTSAWPILRFEKYTGVTLHEIDRGIDTGNIIKQEKIFIDGGETAKTLHKKYMINGTLLVKNYIQQLIENTVSSDPQSVLGSTYFSKRSIDYQNLQVRLNVTAYELDAQIRAFSYRAYQIATVFEKKIIRCSITHQKSNCRAGKILAENGHSITVSTIDFDVILYKDRFIEFINACKTNDIEMVKQLFDLAYLEDKTKEGWTPLIVACYNNSIETAAYLLGIGADVNAINNKGTTSLMYAKSAVIKTNKYDILNLILSYKPNIYTKDYSGKDVFFYLKSESIDVANFIKNHNN